MLADTTPVYMRCEFCGQIVEQEYSYFEARSSIECPNCKSNLIYNPRTVAERLVPKARVGP